MRPLSFILGLLCLIGCQSKESTPLPRTIYDHSVFAEGAKRASRDEAAFAQFRRDPFFNLVWDNFSQEEGEVWLHQILTQYPFLLSHFRACQQGDKIGSPRVYSYGEVGEFSPATLRALTFAGDLKTRFGGWSGKTIIQIGAGHGNLCRVLSEIEPFDRYILVDLAPQLELAKRYLKEFGIENVLYWTPEELPQEGVYDIVVSDWGFSEFGREGQEVLFDRIFARSNAGYIWGYIFPKHYGTIPMAIDVLKGRFKQRGQFSELIFEEPTLEKEHYQIFWNGASKL